MMSFALLFLMAGISVNAQNFQTGETIQVRNLEAPWFSIISNTDRGQGCSRCSAVLIHEDIVLTAPECIYPGAKVRVGYKDDLTAAQVVAIDNYVDSPDRWFLPGGLSFQHNLPNDLTLVKLTEPVVGVAPIRLNGDATVIPPDNSFPVNYAHAGSKRDLWDIPGQPAKDVNDPHFFEMGGFMTEYVYHTYVQIGSTTTEEFFQCRRIWKDLEGYQAHLDEDLQFCVNAAENSPCDSDAWGAPLWVETQQYGPVLIGLGSQGQCSPLSPLGYVYTRILNYYDWILEQTCLLSANPPTEKCDSLMQK